ncbi:MAG: hypothetical protein K1X94_02490 [Sandaracinaceae bacterium]|nr:hypothetical protein [Sandaracinaceae bacterium]
MADALLVAQVSIWLVGAAWGASLLRRQLAGVDGSKLARVLRGLPRREQGDILARCRGAVALLGPVLVADDPDEASLRLAEQWARAERLCTGGLPWLRILGLTASALGFVAVAYQISWLHADHGLLDLDPVAVGRMASQRAAISLALAVAASGTTVALGSAVRTGGRRTLAGVGAIRDLIDRQLPRWTPVERKC